MSTNLLDQLEEAVADLRFQVALSNRHLECAAELRAEAADPDKSITARVNYNQCAAREQTKADSLGQMIEATRATIAALERRLHGELFDRVMADQHAAVDETAGLL